MTHWSRRFRSSTGPRDVRQFRDAAQDLAAHAGNAPGKTRMVFETVADVSLIATAVISGALASVHLWKALFPAKRDHQPASDDTGKENARHQHFRHARNR